MSSERNRKVTNIIGLVALAIFVMFIVATKVAKSVAERKNKEETEESLLHVCNGFKANDKAIIHSWACGAYQDAWDNDLILIDSASSTGLTVFASKGPDGELNTDDDIRHAVLRPTLHDQLKAVKDDASFYELTGEAVNKAVEKSGFRFKFWGKKE